MESLHERIVRDNRAYAHVILLVEKILNAIESNHMTELRELIAHVKSKYSDEWNEMETLSNEWRDDNE
ncbi:MAG: hypothetical protein CME17_05055 [Gemmatimonadetes bacterium]|nr:hypothetical protein [Gemmatimonadota bacterium]